MSQPTEIHKGKTPPRIHFIVEWAERRGWKQAEISRELNVDKGTVSRWFAGNLPETGSLVRLAALFECESPNELFRHPDDNWFKQMFNGRKQDEIDDTKEIVRVHLKQSKRTGTNG